MRSTLVSNASIAPRRLCAVSKGPRLWHTASADTAGALAALDARCAAPRPASEYSVSVAMPGSFAGSGLRLRLAVQRPPAGHAQVHAYQQQDQRAQQHQGLASFT
jgi:hypothetical protein